MPCSYSTHKLWFKSAFLYIRYSMTPKKQTLITPPQLYCNSMLLRYYHNSTHKYTLSPMNSHPSIVVLPFYKNKERATAPCPECLFTSILRNNYFIHLYCLMPVVDSNPIEPVSCRLIGWSRSIRPWIQDVSLKSRHSLMRWSTVCSGT